jgi:hypothetical protein
MERVQRNPMLTDIDLELVRNYRDQQRYEASFKNTAEEPDDNDWPRTLENVKE